MKTKRQNLVDKEHDTMKMEFTNNNDIRRPNTEQHGESSPLPEDDTHSHNQTDSHEKLDVESKVATEDFYQILGVDRNANQNEISRAYRHLALKTHPDKFSHADVKDEDRENAHYQFLRLNLAYSILSNKEKRAVYDITGYTGNQDILDVNAAANPSLFRSIITEELKNLGVNPIEKFRREYQGSAEEIDDVLRIYEEQKGDMDAIYEHVILSCPLNDDKRFKQIIDEAIEAGKVTEWEAYTQESHKKKNNRLKRARAEEQEAEEMARDLGVYDQLFSNEKSESNQGRKNVKGKNSKSRKNLDDNEANDPQEADPELSGLGMLIRSRQSERSNRQESFLDHLTKKYGAIENNSRNKSSKNRRKAAK